MWVRRTWHHPSLPGIFFFVLSQLHSARTHSCTDYGGAQLFTNHGHHSLLLCLAGLHACPEPDWKKLTRLTPQKVREGAQLHLTLASGSSECCVLLCEFSCYGAKSACLGSCGGFLQRLSPCLCLLPSLPPILTTAYYAVRKQIRQANGRWNERRCDAARMPQDSVLSPSTCVPQALS